MHEMKRTANCGQLSAKDAGKTVILNGWVHRKRDHGEIAFINLRDRYGLTQVVIEAEAPAELKVLAGELRNEFCIAVEGQVRARPQDMINTDMPTGDMELVASRLLILNRCEVLPFQIDAEADAKEELRLKYRYLDLRRSGMQKRIALRSAVIQATRQYMTGEGFLEIETPTFIKSTPEGARDYLVPSRLYPGKFYALPQSPQLYKQLLMVSGMDKYFQIARCYRDEDARGDRQPEFTQIDIEMSFVDRDDVLAMTEGLMGHIFATTMGIQLPTPFRRLSWEEAYERYGSDKPDLRFDLELQDLGPYVADSNFQAFKDALATGEAERREKEARGITGVGGGVKALVLPGRADYSRKQIEELEALAKIYKARGLAWMKVGEQTGGKPGLEGGVSKFFKTDATNGIPADLEERVLTGLGAKTGDLILIVADSKRHTANVALGAVRARLGKDLGLCDPKKFEFAWIIDFPMFEYDEEQGRWETAHHLFTWPQNRYHENLEKDPGAVKGDLYDLVLNGFELASGSIRIHDPDLQKRIFNIVGFDPKEAEARFGFLTESFKYGAPPHGGIAPGLDRLVMIMAGQTSIKEVIAFPKNSFAVSPMDEAPSYVDQGQIDDLHLRITMPEDGK